MEMLFSQNRRFRPSNDTDSAGHNRDRFNSVDKMKGFSTFPYNTTRHNLPFENEPNTPTLKRYVRKMEIIEIGGNCDRNGDNCGSRPTSVTFSSPPVSPNRPANWIMDDGNWTMTRRKVKVNFREAPRRRNEHGAVSELPQIRFSNSPSPVDNVHDHFGEQCCVCTPNGHHDISKSGPISIIVHRSPSQCSSVSNENNPENQYKSCPDLIRPCIKSSKNGSNLLIPATSGENGSQGKNGSPTNRRRSEKPFQKWTLDDILVWLEKIGMEEVSHILIGYDLCGTDLETWDNDVLASYGIINPETRSSLLKAVYRLKNEKKQHGSPVQVVSTPLLLRKWSGESNKSGKSVVLPMNSLYYVIKQTGYDQIVAIDFPSDVTPFRAFTVARKDGRYLVITGCKHSTIPLLIGDIVLEYNGENCLPLAAVDFHVLISQTSRKPNTIVVLRKRGDSGSTIRQSNIRSISHLDNNIDHAVTRL